MTEQSIAEMLASAAPIDDRDVAAHPLAGLDDELKEAIMSVEAPVALESPAPVPAPTRRRLRALLAAAVAAAIAIVVVVAAPSEPGGDSAWAAEVLAVAQASPRLLVDLAGWSVDRAHTFTVEEGEMTFSNGEYSLDLRWRPAATHEEFVRDRAASSEPPVETTVNGQQAVRFQYRETTDFTTLWIDGDHSFEVRGAFPSASDYATVVDALAPTDVDTWLSAMPASVVKPDGRAATVEEMLTDLPLPAGFDASGLVAGSDVEDRYQLGARVAGAVACAWIEQWIDARAAGDSGAESEALAAMRSSHEWPVLIEMQQSGAYPQVLWQQVAAMEAGGRHPDGFGINGYRAALGCP